MRGPSWAGDGGAAPDPRGWPAAAVEPDWGGPEWGWRVERVLRRLGPRVVPALAEALRTGRDPAVRRFAAVSLGRRGREACLAAEILRQVARHDGDPAVREAAAAALGAVTEGGRGA
jgi:HEAT repeat protein